MSTMLFVFFRKDHSDWEFISAVDEKDAWNKLLEIVVTKSQLRKWELSGGIR